jgi:hypothetical protein
MVQLIGIGSTDTRWAAAASERKRLKHADHAKRFQARRAQGVVAGTSMTSWRMKSSGKSWQYVRSSEEAFRISVRSRMIAR